MSDPIVIVALDVENAAEAARLIRILPKVTHFKLGPHFFLDLEFASLVTREWSASARDNPWFFIDFKNFDIPETVYRAARHMTDNMVGFLTVHAHIATMRAAVSAARLGTDVLAVPLLTSFGPEDLKEFFNYNGPVIDFVLERTRRAVDCGCHGVVCSPQEVAAMRAIVPDDFSIVVPGIRPEWASTDDHKRFGTPKQAVDGGADYLVVGRPIVQATNPEEAYQRILDEING